MSAIKSINAAMAHEWVSNNEAVIVDVREQSEFDTMHIAGATLIPVGIIDNHLLPELEGKKLIIHCLHGKRGGLACEKLLQNNPDLDVYNLEGGITAWEREGYKIEK